MPRPLPALLLPSVLLGVTLAMGNVVSAQSQRSKPAASRVAGLPAGGAATSNSRSSMRPATSPLPREQAERFAADVSERRGLARAFVDHALAQARLLPQVQRLVMPPPAGTAKNWAAYRARFIEPQRIAAGQRFWETHERWLHQAEERYGVPAHIIVGIVGVETFYGRVMGEFRVLDALATLAFDFPKGRSDRSEFFRSELEELLVHAQREGIEPATLKGSFAGAIGLPQFMPGSINRFAVDFDADGHIDLHANVADVIGSVARYLADHGWQRGQPTHYPVSAPVDTSERARLLQPDILPSFSAVQMEQAGAALGDAGRVHDGPLALVELQNGAAAPSFVAGTQNFYAVTRYNRSSYYALAVIELGEAVAASRKPPATQATRP